MLATQLMSGSGGWPMSVWLTPQLEPFYAGTYFPPDDRYGRPGFPRLIQSLAGTWRERRETLLEQSRRVGEAIRLHADETEHAAPQIQTAPEVSAASPGWIRLAIEQMTDRFD